MSDETGRLVRACARNLEAAAALMIEATRDDAPPDQLQAAVNAKAALSSAVERIGGHQSWCDPDFVATHDIVEAIANLAVAVHPLAANS